MKMLPCVLSLLFGFSLCVSVSHAEISRELCLHLAETQHSVDDTLARDASFNGREQSGAGNYWGRDAWLAEVPELMRRVAESGQADLRSPSGFTPLQVACMRGEAQLAVALIEAGADVNARPNGWEKMGFPGYTPLVMLLSYSRNMSADECLQVAQALLEKGADPDAAVPVRIWEHTWLESPFELCHNEALRRLLLRYGNPNLSERVAKWSFIWNLCGPELIRDLLEGGVHPDSHVGEKGATLMHTLLFKYPNRPDLVELALQKGASVKCVTRGNRYFSDYPFCLNVGSDVQPENAVRIISLLLDAGADIHALNRGGDSLRIHYGRFSTAAARAVGALLRERGALLHPDAPASRHR